MDEKHSLESHNIKSCCRGNREYVNEGVRELERHETTAFDCIQHNLLFYSLIKNGIHGNVLNVLESMYKNLKSCVKTTQGITELFQCSTGTRQGCMLSPFLVTLFLNEYISMIINSNCQGVYIDEVVPNLMVLLYADDLCNVLIFLVDFKVS